MSADNEITPQSEDFSAWYNDVVQHAELADHSPVRGCMVIRPYAYRIWELMRDALDEQFKHTGHENAYFPLFMPQESLDREAEHVEGFSPETAMVTEAGGSELEEPLAVRPTSEAVIWPIVADWIQSYRDLPVKLNQWANVVRWEMRTRPFLRTTEFLWQEGHTAHATAEEAEEEARTMLGVYRDFMEDWMAMPVVTGQKTDAERFAGAERTYACEAMMKDDKALQAGTSHFLGQNFAEAFDVRFQSEEGEHEYVYNTSWGVSTRLIGGLIMSHGDDQGLILPPKLAPHQVVIVPIWSDEEEHELVMTVAERVNRVLSRNVRVHVDDREHLSPGAKYYEWERKGVPLRIEIGPQEVSGQELVTVRRYAPGDRERKRTYGEGKAIAMVPQVLEEIQDDLLAAARRRREERSVRGMEDYDEFRQHIDEERGFVYSGWCGDADCEEKAREESKGTIRVIPDPEFRSDDPPSTCLVCGDEATEEVLWAQAY